MKTCHSLRAEPLACVGSCTAREESYHHLTHLRLRHRQCKAPRPKWDTLQEHLKNNYKLLTCKKERKNQQQ